MLIFSMPFNRLLLRLGTELKKGPPSPKAGEPRDSVD